MQFPNISQPTTPDYYADLGLSMNATLQQIKAAFFKLARRHHPDKKAPGKTVDAQEFRKVREAYEFLKDETKRKQYNVFYGASLQRHWAVYRQQQEAQRRHAETMRREAAQREAQQKAAAAESERKMKEQMEASRARAEEERKRGENTRESEAGTEEAARKAQELYEAAARERLLVNQERQRMYEEMARMQQERQTILQEAEMLRRGKEVAACMLRVIYQREVRRRAAEAAAQEQLRRQQEAEAENLWAQKEREAERRSEEATKRVRAQQERAARQRLNSILIEEKQRALCFFWRGMAEHRDAETATGGERQAEPPNAKECEHPPFGWPKIQGSAECMFCGEVRKTWAYGCPEPQCGAKACPSCEHKYCIF